MLALTVAPHVPNSMRLDNVPEPGSDSDVLVKTMAIGICGTDREIVAGSYGSAPDGADRLVIGHESLGRVLDAPSGSHLRSGDLVAGIVRRPDPVPCPACAHGEWDMCRNVLYTERGIKQRNGYAAERFRVESEFAIMLDPDLHTCGVLLEPTSIVAKAWDQIERIGSRTRSWQPRTVLITGAGPIGLLAALLRRQRGCDIHVYDLHESGAKPELVRALGASYHFRDLGGFAADLVIECTGATPVILEAVKRVAPDGIVCLAGLSSGGHKLQLDVGRLARTMVLENSVVFGSVNANRKHYEAAAAALVRADRDWLGRLITRRVPLDRWNEALIRDSNDIKVIIEFSD